MVFLPSLVRRIRPEDLHYPYEMETNRQFIAFANGMLRPRPSSAVEIYMLCDVVQCLITFIACVNVLVKKGRLRNLRIFSLRKSGHGTFIVPNAVVVLLIGVCVYLLEWAGFCSYIVWVQKTDRPVFEWLWFIPYPWLPLALAGFYSAYGFVITCSPRSPISNLGGRKQSGTTLGKLSWIYLPLPHSAWLMNTFMIGVGVVMIVYNTVIQSMNAAQIAHSHSPGHNFYQDYLIVPYTEAFLNEPPTQEVLAFGLVAWADGMNIYRYCCLALTSYMVVVAIGIAMLVFYSIPNQIFLMKHLCRTFPDEVPEKCQGDSLLSNVRLLGRIGSPRNLKGSSYSAFKKTWMMTMVGHSQAILLIGGFVSFAVPPYYLYFVPWNNAIHGRSSENQIIFIVAYTISAAFLMAGWVTGLAATLTFDDIFKAVSGLGNSQEAVSTLSRSQSHVVAPSRRGWSGIRSIPGVRLLLPRGESQKAFDDVDACSSDVSGKNSLHLRTTTLASPSKCSFAKDDPPFSQLTATQSRGFLRPQLSFTPSSGGDTIEEKRSASFDNNMDLEANGNKMFVVTQTVVRVEHTEVDEAAGGFDSVPMYPNLSRHLSRQASVPPTSKPFSFLSRNTNRNSK